MPDSTLVTGPSDLSVQVVGQHPDEDVWDRVVGLWHASLTGGRSPAAPDGFREATRSLRAALGDGDAQLLLVAHGPRLLAFATIGTDRPRSYVRDVRVRPGTAEGVVLNVLVEAALHVARERDTWPRRLVTSPAAA